MDDLELMNSPVLRDLLAWRIVMNISEQDSEVQEQESSPSFKNLERK